MINNKSVLITGGTGSFGTKFIQMVLDITLMLLLAIQLLVSTQVTLELHTEPHLGQLYLTRDTKKILQTLQLDLALSMLYNLEHLSIKQLVSYPKLLMLMKLILQMSIRTLLLITDLLHKRLKLLLMLMLVLKMVLRCGTREQMVHKKQQKQQSYQSQLKQYKN